MSAPEDRLVGECEAEQLQRDAVAILSVHPHLNPAAHRLSLAVLALIRDRSARLELSAALRSQRSA